jgi:hypothetical protein
MIREKEIKEKVRQNKILRRKRERKKFVIIFYK